MTDHPFTEADRAFRLARESKNILHRVESRKTRAFADALYSFLRQSDSLDEDPVWGKVIRKLKRYFFNLRSAPVHGGLDAALSEEAVSLLERAVSRTRSTFPDLTSSAENLYEATLSLRESSENPLLDAMEPEIEGRGSGATIVLKSGRLKEAVRQVLENRFPEKSPAVIKLSELTHASTYDVLLIPGRPGWFEDSGLFHAPYAPETHIYVFDWYPDRIEIRRTFPYGVSGDLPAVVNPEPPSDFDSTEGAVDLDTLEPDSDWDSIVESISTSRGVDEGEGGSTPVEVRLFLLAGGRAVFLPVGGDHSVVTLQMRSEVDPEVSRLSVENLEAGDYILLRTEGGGNLVGEIADELLGERSGLLREHQIEWIEELCREVEKRGTSAVAEELQDLGASGATPTNVRRWSEGGTIKPRRYEDFDSIMKLIGLGDKTDQYWKHMRLINSAHHRAGHRIRKLLLEKTKEIDAEVLREEGCLTIELGTPEGGSMTAYRIHHVASDTETVPSRETGHPFDHDR